MRKRADAFKLQHGITDDYDQPPQADKTSPPHYPDSAFKNCIDGTVSMLIFIDARGRVSDAEIVESIPALDEEALATVRKWRFKPARRAGAPVPSVAAAPVAFQLDASARRTAGCADPPAPDLSRLRSPAPEERIAALDAIRALPGAHPELLEPVANVLLDEVPHVRSVAAYALSQLAVRLGCRPFDFLACKLFDSVLDKTPSRETKLKLDYPEVAKNSGNQGAVTVQFLVREDGSVADLNVVRGDAVFANPVVNALRAQHYKPAMRKGRPVPFAYLFEATFTMTVVQ